MVKDMRLETKRLIIRPYIEDDLMESFHLMQDKELFKYKNMDVMTLDEHKRLFRWLIDSYNVGFDQDFKYSFNIILKETGVHIGWVGIGVLDSDTIKKEIYYLIERQSWGKGYATEASLAMLDYGFNTIGLDEIVALAMPKNIASKRVIEKMGMKFKSIVGDPPHEFYYLTKNEYLRTL